jgi:hypothetical protein
MKIFRSGGQGGNVRMRGINYQGAETKPKTVYETNPSR